MGDVTRQLVQRLNDGSLNPIDDLWKVGALLESFFYKEGCDHRKLPGLEHEELSEAEIHELREALTNAYQREVNSGRRRAFLLLLARDPDNPPSRATLLKELHLLLTVHRAISSDLCNVLHALREGGESIASLGGTGEVDRNVAAAQEVLGREGIVVP